MDQELDFEDLISQNIITNNEDSKVQVERRQLKQYDLVFNEKDASYKIHVRTEESAESSDEEPLISIQKKIRTSNTYTYAKNRSPAKLGRRVKCTCDECGVVFKNARGLKRHKYVHRNKSNKPADSTIEQEENGSEYDTIEDEKQQKKLKTKAELKDMSISYTHVKNGRRRNHITGDEEENLQEHDEDESLRKITRKSLSRQMKWSCEECDLQFDSIAKLETHNEDHLNPRYSWSDPGELEDANDVDYEAENSESEENDDDDNENGNIFEAEVQIQELECDEEPEPEAEQVEEKIEEIKNANPYACNQCDKVCSSTSGLTRHVTRVHKIKR